MTDIFQVFAIGIITVILTVLIKEHRPELALLTALCGGVLIFVSIMPAIRQFFATIEAFAGGSGLGFTYLAPVIKIIGIAYISHYGAELCRDAGEGSLGLKVEMAGKIIILAMAAPIVAGLLNTIIKIVP